MKKNKKALRDGLIAIVVIIAILVIAAVVVYGIVAGNNIAPSMADTMDTIKNCSVQIILIIVGLIVIIAATIVSANMKKSRKFLVRGEGIIAGVMAVLLAANWICFGPLNALMSVTFTDSYAMSEETKAAGEALNEQLCDEGIVLLKNKNGALPLTDTTNVNIFGWGTIDPIYGGAGSGAGKGTGVSLLEGVENAGFQVNRDLINFYTEYNDTRPMGSGVGANDLTLPEPVVADYTDELMDKAKEFSDVAFVVLCRQGAENLDLPSDMPEAVEEETVVYNTADKGMGHEGDFTEGMSYLEMSNSERSMVKMVCSEFSKVVVIVNSANPMELGWLDEYDSIQGALLVPGTGVNGFNSLGKILSGEVNPSGRTVDTYVYDLLDTPAANNYGDLNHEYNNTDDLLYVNDTAAEVGGGGVGLNEGMFFVNYVEGIYVGYKFYETASDEGLIDYNEKVQFPFGYGLSYTSFTQEITEVKEDNGEVTMSVAVTNTGDTAGKDVVEVYFNPPYYNGGIEKSSANLLDFEKTAMMEPGETETVEISFSYDDLASYDTYENGSYVTEHGDYEISIRSDSHNIIDTESISIEDDIIYNNENDGARTSDETVAENVFQFVEGKVTYLSRTDSFANYDEATAEPSEEAYAMTQEQKDTLVNLKTWLPEEHDDDSDVMPAMGEDNGLTFYDMKDVEYDDAKWDELLDQMNFKEMAELVGIGGYRTSAVASIGLPASLQSDGPSCLNASFAANVESGTAFCCGTMVASTWSKELSYERGAMMGKEADDMHVTGWYGPGVNTHRSAFGGRNFEYYSEDGILAGYICAGEVQGARDNGLLAYMKHFALNDQETNRDRQLMTWSNEQTIREIYLKPFELAVKEGNAMATMTSFNFIGNIWAGGYEELLQTVLRDEWGFEGVVVTDWYNGSNSGYMDSNLATRSGGDQMLSLTGTGGAIVTDDSATATIALRKSCHNILFGLTQTNMINWENEEASWIKLVRGIDIAAAVLLIAAQAVLAAGYRKRSREEAGDKKEQAL